MKTQSQTRPVEKCRKCNGSGSVPLSGHLVALLSAIRKARGPVPTDELPSEECGDTGRNERLCKLEGLGLIERVGKRSKTVLWAAVPKQAGAASAPAVCYSKPLSRDTIRKAAAWLEFAEFWANIQRSEMRRAGLAEEAAAKKQKAKELPDIIAELKAALE